VCWPGKKQRRSCCECQSA